MVTTKILFITPVAICKFRGWEGWKCIGFYQLKERIMLIAIEMTSHSTVWLNFYHDNQPVYNSLGRWTKRNPIGDMMIWYLQKHLYNQYWKTINYVFHHHCLATTIYTNGLYMKYWSVLCIIWYALHIRLKLQLYYPIFIMVHKEFYIYYFTQQQIKCIIL